MIKEWIAGITNFNSVLRPISKFNHQSQHPSFAINRTLVTRTDINRSRFFDFFHNNTQLDKFKAFQPHGECYQHSRDFLFSYHNKHDLKGEASKENAICSVDVDPRALMKNVTPSHIQNIIDSRGPLLLFAYGIADQGKTHGVSSGYQQSFSATGLHSLVILGTDVLLKQRGWEDFIISYDPDNTLVECMLEGYRPDGHLIKEKVGDELWRDRNKLKSWLEESGKQLSDLTIGDLKKENLEHLVLRTDVIKDFSGTIEFQSEMGTGIQCLKNKP